MVVARTLLQPTARLRSRRWLTQHCHWPPDSRSRLQRATAVEARTRRRLVLVLALVPGAVRVTNDGVERALACCRLEAARALRGECGVHRFVEEVHSKSKLTHTDRYHIYILDAPSLLCSPALALIHPARDLTAGIRSDANLTTEARQTC